MAGSKGVHGGLGSTWQDPWGSTEDKRSHGRLQVKRDSETKTHQLLKNI